MVKEKSEKKNKKRKTKAYFETDRGKWEPEELNKGRMES